MIEDLVGRIVGTSSEQLLRAQERQLQLTKPPGALGNLEMIGNRLCAIQRECPPRALEVPHVVIFASDHGVVQEGVTPWPSEVTAQMVQNFLSGGAAINVIARAVGAEVTVVDVGVASDLTPCAGLVIKKIRRGTDSFFHGPAMSLSEARRSVEVGVEIARSLIGGGVDLLCTGEMGIGNTTAAASVIGAALDLPASAVVGRGTGIDDAMLMHKTEVVQVALDRLAGRNLDPLELLSEVGGFEIGAIAGLILGGAEAFVPVVIDGVIALAGAILAQLLAPLSIGYCFGGHRSTEPAATLALRKLDLVPIVEASMRLGEGSGAALAVPYIQIGANILREMTTFDAAGVSHKE